MRRKVGRRLLLVCRPGRRNRKGNLYDHSESTYVYSSGRRRLLWPRPTCVSAAGRRTLMPRRSRWLGGENE
jgi:hypothetical protein